MKVENKNENSTVRISITIQGGLVQSVHSNDSTVDVKVIDLDIEGMDEEESDAARQAAEELSKEIEEGKMVMVW